MRALKSWAALALGTCGAAILRPLPVHAQEPTARLRVRVEAEGVPLSGAQVNSGQVAAITDSMGAAVLPLPPGSRRVIARKLGYSADTLSVTLRGGEDTTVVVLLSPVAQQIEGLVVTATRVERRVEEEPERVEVLAAEDVGEKAVTRPGNLTNLLVDMGGVRMQPGAGGLGGASIRLQGLPGEYTLLLTDGLPLYGTQAPVFSLAQVPPLDLAQVEVIKGAATALYGPSALGGVVLLRTRRPAPAREALLSQTTRGGSDGLLWLSDTLSARWGYTFLGGLHHQVREDVNADAWADLPGYTRGEARPRLFWTGENGSSLLFTAGGTWEDRAGGTLPGGTVPAGIPFPETLRTRHADAGLNGHLLLAPGVLGVRASASGTQHHRGFGESTEEEHQSTFFGEATLSRAAGRHTPVAGVSLQRDALGVSPDVGADFDFTTLSLFAQDTYEATGRLALSGAARLDHHSRYGTFLSPRVSALYRLGGEWSARASGGAGFFAPTPLTTETQEFGFSRYAATMQSWRVSRGESASFDLSGDVGPLQLTGTLFGVQVQNPLLPRLLDAGTGRFTLENAPGPIRSAGALLYAVYDREPLLVTATYSHTRASELSAEEGRRISLPLTPRNSGGVDVAWEEDEPGAAGFRVAVEAYYTGPQRLEEDPYRTWAPGYSTVELLASKRLGRVMLFGNVENLTNVRQTHWDPFLRPSPGLGGSWTTDDWAPIEGRILNVGARVSF